MLPLIVLLLNIAAVSGLATARSAGCGDRPPKSGTKTIDVDGQTREYILKVPEDYDRNRTHRLVFAFHSFGHDMQDVSDEDFYGLKPLAEGTTVFVAPGGGDNYWMNLVGEDVAFAVALAEKITSELCIDEAQIFSTGFSMGASMSYALACEQPDIFRGIAAISTEELSGCVGGKTPVPYLGIHGVGDPWLSIAKGRFVRDKFLRLNDCKLKTARQPGPGTKKHIKTEYDCDPEYPVQWIAHSGNHKWDQTDADGDHWVPTEIWDFFNLVADK